jgi:hypothetical protein
MESIDGCIGRVCIGGGVGVEVEVRVKTLDVVQVLASVSPWLRCVS